ncbi:hypothetical protein [Martelella endophytica]|uniref:Glycosyltransferase n=1 Tax=Martelella endophytica TaxID=1486262 RepID=A0A0D5LLM0_MAREN|nr:hypothetical protein [Martelella endophytica]AJY44667.1 hypothetical protein TM49_01585 [Martelella endophytica]
MTRVVCVLRSGGEYGPEHVLRLQRQVSLFSQADFLCLSDCAIDGVDTLPLLFDWPGWWAKMELFRPDIAGPLFYLDLDMAITGPLADLMAIGRLAIMRDVYRPDGLQSAAMLLPEADRRPVWNAWISDPRSAMRRFRRGGDQSFLEQLWLRRAVRLQDELPGSIVSYKADVRETGNIGVASIVAFHGKPRPWDVGW